MLINRIVDLEKDLRLSEDFLSGMSLCGTGIPRNMNCCRDELWFSLMEDEGFLVDGKFLPIVDILIIAEGMTETKRVFTLESVGCDLSEIYKIVIGE